MEFEKIKEITIKNYKGIDFLNFSPKSINIIVGPNNTGKSSILNGISLTLFSLNGFRSKDFTNIFNIRHLHSLEYLIYRNEINSRISIDIKNNEESIKHFDLDIFFSKTMPPNIDINKQSFLELIFKQSSEYAENELSNFIKRFSQHEIEIRPNIIDDKKSELMNQVYRELAKSFKNTVFFKLIYEDQILIESVVRRPVKKFYKYPFEIFENYFIDKKRLRSLKGQIECDFIFRSQSERRNITEYFRELSTSSKFYEVLEKLKEKLNYIYDIREIDGSIKIVVRGIGEEKTFIPFESMGDGFQSLLILNIIFEIFKSGIVLLEEPENSLHPGYMDILADIIISKSNMHQYFISTHSIELIDLLVKKAKKTNNLDKILILRLSRNNNKVDREILLKDEILEELEEIKIDLRGY